MKNLNKDAADIYTALLNGAVVYMYTNNGKNVSIVSSKAGARKVRRADVEAARKALYDSGRKLSRESRDVKINGNFVYADCLEVV